LGIDHQRGQYYEQCKRSQSLGNKAKRLEGKAVMSAPPFFQSAGRGDLNFWGEDDGPTVVVWESLSESEQEHSPGRKDGQVEVLGGLVQLKEKRRRATSV